uniref:NR LBD domain-containing protein n=1 Tax=Acrobeloides nanus TaxID=290746 RepID=A0A914D2I7_9BILA
MKQLRITQFEIVYLLVYMIFDHDIGNLSMDATKIIEDIIEQVATELHNHYIQEM